MSQLHRTFVKLDKKELKILHALRKIMCKPNGKLPPQSEVIRAVIRDYWEILLEARSTPEGSPTQNDVAV